MATLSCAHCGATLAATLRSCPDCGVAVPGADPLGAHALEEGALPGQVPLPQDGGRALHTAVAIQALDLAESFDLRFEEVLPTFRAELGKPGMSTGGGKQSRQHLMLHGARGVSIVIGSFDRSASLVELRSYRHLAAAYRHRFGVSFPVHEAAYAGFVTKVARFFHDEEVVVRTGVDPTGRAASSGPPTWVWLAIMAVVVAAAAGATWVLVEPPPPPPPPAAAMPAR